MNESKNKQTFFSSAESLQLVVTVRRETTCNMVLQRHAVNCKNSKISKQTLDNFQSIEECFQLSLWMLIILFTNALYIFLLQLPHKLQHLLLKTTDTIKPLQIAYFIYLLIHLKRKNADVSNFLLPLQKHPLMRF